MIKTLALKNFGKYKNKNIEFNDTTVFFGDNEAGKTTIFDAIYYGLCRPALNKTRRNLKRYANTNDGLDVEINNENGVLKTVLDDEEFLNLYAIGPGDIHIKMSSKSKKNSYPAWLQKVESTLLSGGIDSSRIITDLESISSDSKTYKHNKDLEKYTNLLYIYEQDLKNKKSEREGILSKKNTVHEYDTEIGRLYGDLPKLEEKSEKLKQEVDKENKILDREKYTTILREIENFKGLNNNIEKLSRYSESKVGEYDKIEKYARDIEADIVKLEAEIEGLNGLINNKNNELLTLKTRYGEYTTKSKVANELLNQIYTYEGGPGETITSSNNYLFGSGIIVMIVGILVGIFGFIVGFESYIIILLAGIMLFIFGIILLVFSKKSKNVPPRINSVFLNQIKESWRNNNLGEKFEGIQSREEMIDILNQIKASPNALEGQLKGLNSEIEDYGTKISYKNKQLKEKNIELATGKQLLEKWLKDYNVASRDEYLARVQLFDTTQSGLIKSKEFLDKAMEKEGWTDLESSEVESKRKLELLDKEFIPYKSDRTNLEIEKLKKELDVTLKKINSIEEIIKEIQMNKEGLSGEIRGSSKDLDEEIVTLIKEIKKYENEINRIDLDKKAARVALELFENIKKDNSLMFEELGNEISEMYSMITPKHSDVNLTELNNNKIRVMDVNGEFRAIEDLSSGARDSFYFALRLSLAKKNLCEEKILLLDDPFLTLDRYRERKAIELLRAYQERENWQIILFTKEERLKDLVSEAFPNSLSYNVEGLV